VLLGRIVIGERGTARCSSVQKISDVSRGKKLGKHSQEEATLEGMSNLKLGVQIVGAIAIAFLMAFLVSRLIFLFPGIGSDAQMYIGIALLISSCVAVLWGYLRYQRLM
jgi:hypothetical protein